MQLVSSSEPCCVIKSSIVSGRLSFLAVFRRSCSALEFLFKIQDVGSSEWCNRLGRFGPARKVDIWNSIDCRLVDICPNTE